MPLPGPAAGGRPPAGASPAAPSLFTSIRTFWRVLIAVFHTRLDLLTAELEDQAKRLVYLAITVAVALACLHAGFFFGMLFLLAAFWDTQYRLWVIGGICLLYLLVAIICLIITRNMIASRPRFLEQTLTELKKDVAGLQTAVPTPEKKP